MRIVYFTKVTKVFRHNPVTSGAKVGDEVKFVTEDRGWFVLMEGSQEAIHVGMEEPNNIRIGQQVKATLEFKQ